MTAPKRPFQWDEIQSISYPERNILALTNVGAILLLACSHFYNDRRYWQDGESEISDSQWNEISHRIGEMEHDIMSGLIGMIVPNVINSYLGINLLHCDGGIYNKADYPLLYAAIDPAFIIDPDTFFTPDLRERFPLGTGIDFAIGDTGGERNHLLTIDEMPLHSHTNTPHSHSEITAVPALADLGTGVPVPSAVVGVGVTGGASIAIQNTGGNETHNNMPPYLAVKWAIVAG